MSTDFVGISQNDCKFQGKVVGAPFITENFASFTLRTIVSELATNGQWVESIIDIPVMTMEPGKVRTIRDHVPEGRRVLVDAYYKFWEDPQNGPQHGFFVRKLTLGYKPKEQ